MNDLSVRALEGEVLSRHDRVRVIGRPHPLRAERVDLTAPAGLSVAEVMNLALAGTRHSRLAGRFAVHVDGVPVPRAWWPRVRLKPGVTLTFAAVAEGKFGRSLAMIAVAVLAMVVAPWAAGLMFTAGTTMFSLASAVIGGGIAIAGSLAVNALFPVRPAESAVEGRSNVHSIGGARNRLEPFAPIPTILGRVRVSPRFAAKPYTEIIGNDQYLRMLFCWGYGPLDISDLKLGETPLANYEGVEIETFYGYPDDDTPTLYPSQVLQEDLSIELTYAAGWQQRLTAEDVEEISLDFMAPEGVIFYWKKDGRKLDWNAYASIEYRAVGATDWIIAGYVQFSGRTENPMRRGWRQAVAKGQYEVRVRNPVPAYSGEDQVREKVVWTALRGMRSARPVAYRKPLAITALRIKATAQLNNVVDSFNGVVVSRVTAWEPGLEEWVEDMPSQNPADLFRWILQGPANDSPCTDEMIDLEALVRWHGYCEAEGFRFNLERDTRTSVVAALQDVCSAGRGRLTRTDGVWGVIWDEADIPVAQHFTPRNSWGFGWKRIYRNLPHGWRVRFVNEDKGFVEDERIVYADGFDASTATRFEGLEFPGVTTAGAVWRHGRFHLAQAELRPDIYTLETNWQFLSCTVGDKVLVAHDAAFWGHTQGRVRAVEIDGDVQTVTLDTDVIMDADGAYVIRFRLADGSSLLRSVVTEPGEGRVVTLAGDGELPLPEAGDLFMFGSADLETVVLRVRSIEPLPDLRARLTLVDDAPEIALADQGAIPPFESKISVPPDLFIIAPTRLAIQELLYVDGAEVKAAARLTWQVARIERITWFEVQVRNDTVEAPTWAAAGMVPPAQLTCDVRDLSTGTYSFRVRSLFDDGTPSAWYSLTNVAFVGLQRAPEDVEDFAIRIRGDVATLTWGAVAALNLSHYVIRYTPETSDVSWGSSSLLLPSVTGTAADIPTLAGTFLIKAVTRDGVESENAALIVSDVAAIAQLNVVEVLREDPAFAGATESVVYDGSIQAIRLAGGLNILEQEDVLSIPNVLYRAPVTEGVYYFSGFLDLGEVFTCRLSSRLVAYGENTLDDVFARDDWFAVSDFFGGDIADWDVRIEFRQTDDDPEDEDADWGDWVSLVIGDHTARAFEFRAVLEGYVVGVTPLVTLLEVTVDMPDRVEGVDDIVCGVDGVRVLFDPPFLARPAVAISRQGLQSGDFEVITDKDAFGFTIQFFNASNEPIERTFDYVARGYGRELS